VTVVGIPLALGLLAALPLVYALGYSATGWTLGPVDPTQTNRLGRGLPRRLGNPSRDHPGRVLGGLTRFAAATFGLGTLAVAIWRPVAPPSHRRSAG
jgi:hypothetical protein